MRERPIIFSGPMIRALLAGTKTQTRRVVRPQSTGWNPEIFNDGRTVGWCVSGDMDFSEERKCPYGAPGDRLWVRETIRAQFLGEGRWAVRYAADGAGVDLSRELPGEARLLYGVSRPTVPAIFMPRWASRLTLEILSVRVERLQGMSIKDAMAEGVPQLAGEAAALGLIDLATTPGHEWDNRTSVENFALLWDSINGKRAPWASNPWVWRISFRRLDAAPRQGGLFEQGGEG